MIRKWLLAAAAILGLASSPPAYSDTVVSGGRVVFGNDFFVNPAGPQGPTVHFKRPGNAQAWTPGSVIFAYSANELGEDNATFFWNRTTKRLGIGIQPSYELDIRTTVGSSTVLRMGAGIGGHNRIVLGEARTGNGYAYIDLVGDTTYVNYGLRVLRDLGGPNTGSYISHSGTGTFYIGGDQASALALITSGLGRVTVSAGGHVVVGPTLSASAQLQVTADITTALHLNNSNFNPTLTGSSLSFGFGAVTGNTYSVINALSSGNYAWSNLILQEYSGAGLVGIGTTTPTQKLEVYGNLYLNPGYFISNGGSATFQVNDRTGNGNYSQFYRNANVTSFWDNGVGNVINFNNSGNVGINNITPGYTLDIRSTASVNDTYVGIGNGKSGSNAINIGEGRTGNGYAYVDLVGDTTYGDYGIRLIRHNAGPDADSNLTHKGLGSLVILTEHNAPLRFATANADRMRIEANGYVGIGTGTSPAYYPLQVRVVDDHNLIFWNNGGHSGIGSLNNALNGWQNLTIQPAGNTFLNESGGNVGIGNVSPSYKLHVTGETYSTGRFISPAQANQFGQAGGNFNAVTAGTTNILLYNYSAGNWSGIGSHTGGEMYFVTGTSTPISRMVIMSNGLVGIGRTNPQNTLHITDPTDGNSGTMQFGNGYNAGYYHYIHGWSNYFDFIAVGDQISRQSTGNNDGTGQIRFFTSTGTTNAALRMVILSNGLVGINTGSPAYWLDVNGNIRVNQGLTVSGGGLSVTGGLINYGAFDSRNPNAGYQMTDRSQTWTWVLYGLDNIFRIYNNCCGDFVGVNTSGWMGIGTITPTQRLHVVGSVQVDGSIWTSGDNIELGYNRGGDGFSYVDFHTVAGGGGDYQMRLLKEPGQNSAAYIDHVSTGRFYIKENGWEAITITSGAFTGFYKVDPAARIHVNGGAIIGSTASGSNTDGNLGIGNNAINYTPGDWPTQSTLLLTGGPASVIGFHSAGCCVHFIRQNSGTIQMGFNGGFGEANIGMPGGGIWNSSGNVGIGTGGPDRKLYIVGNAYVSTTIETGGTVWSGSEVRAAGSIYTQANYLFLNGACCGLNNQGPLVYGDTNWIILKSGPANTEGFGYWDWAGNARLQAKPNGQIKVNGYLAIYADSNYTQIYDAAGRVGLFLGNGTSWFRNYTLNFDDPGGTNFGYATGAGWVFNVDAKLANNRRVGSFDTTGNYRNLIMVGSDNTMYLGDASYGFTQFNAGSTIHVSTTIMRVYAGSQFEVMNYNAYKNGGGSWLDNSDIRTKKEVFDYRVGLSEVLRLRPVVYKHNGKYDTADNDERYVGFVADEVRKHMPEMVGFRYAKENPDSADYTKILTIDMTALPLALVNSVKELEARIKALEAPGGRPTPQ